MPASILDAIADYTRGRVARAKQLIPEEQLKLLAETARQQELDNSRSPSFFPFEDALKGNDISFICECKKASPSKGIIAPDFPYLTIAKEYESAGASCVSVLTEPHWFLGEDRFLKEIAASVRIPCLRKDFTVDDYMIYEAKLLGASAILLICALTDTGTLAHRIQLCDQLGLSALVEAHDEQEIHSALTAGARIIGVNNRDLKNFTIDIRNSERLRRLVPDSVLFVAESGIRTAEDIDFLRKSHVNGVLIGETLMRAPDKTQMLNELRDIGSQKGDVL